MYTDPPHPKSPIAPLLNYEMAKIWLIWGKNRREVDIIPIMRRNFFPDKG